MCALVVTMKLTALPALAVLARGRARAPGRPPRPDLAIFAGTSVAASAVLVVPVLLVDPAAFVEHVILYPAGLGQARLTGGRARCPGT